MAATKNLKVDPEFGYRFRSAWLRSKHALLNQKELSSVFQVSQQTISSWLHSTRYPFIDTGISIAREFVVNMDWLYVGREPRVPKDPGPYDVLAFRLMGLSNPQLAILKLLITLFENNTITPSTLQTCITSSLHNPLL